VKDEVVQDPIVGAREAKTELREFLHGRDARHRVFPKAALVGALAGLVAVAFRSVLALGDYSRERLVIWSHTVPAGWLLPMLLGAAGTLLALLIVKRWVPETSGSGIPYVESVLRRHRVFRWKSVLVAKFLGGAIAIGSGLALGREGPTVQMGGAIGAGTARVLKTGTQERSLS